MRRALTMSASLLVLLAAVFASVASSSEENGAGGSGTETNSGNDENPPPDDINDDLACSTQAGVGPTASGTLTNHSSGTSGYIISVGFVDEAGTRVADGTAIVNNIQAGQTATWEAPSLSDGTTYATCEITNVDRMAQ
jgi:hypothetical protein